MSTSSTYQAAIRLALDQALAADPRVFIYGQDVACPFGGAFKVTKGLSDKHPGRVCNAPISEDAMGGLAVGAALEGLRPVIEFQFADFAIIALNQMANQAGTTFWRTGRNCPVVFRLPCGATPGGGPFHSQMPEHWLLTFPGIVVLAPATVQDAHHLLHQAIACPDPVIFLEHKALYLHLKDETFDPTPPGPDSLPFTRAVIRRPGRDCTLISYSGMVQTCLAAAAVLADDGIEVEVLDLRCLKPLDHATILTSVGRTGRAVVATEAWPYGSVAAEVTALIAEQAFTALDAPPQRICARDVPIPFHPALLAAHQPSREVIAATVRATVGF